MVLKAKEISQKERESKNSWSFEKWLGRVVGILIAYILIMTLIYFFMPVLVGSDFDFDKIMESSGFPAWIHNLILIGSLGSPLVFMVGYSNRKKVPDEDFDSVRPVVSALGAMLMMVPIIGVIYLTGFADEMRQVMIPALDVLWGLALLIAVFFFYRGRIVAIFGKTQRLVISRAVKKEHQRCLEEELPKIVDCEKNVAYEAGQVAVLSRVVADKLAKIIKQKTNLVWLRPQGSQDRDDFFKVMVDHSAQKVMFAVLIDGQAEFFKLPPLVCQVESKVETEAIDLSLDLSRQGELTSKDLRKLDRGLQEGEIDLLQAFKDYLFEIRIRIDPKKIRSNLPIEIVNDQNSQQAADKTDKRSDFFQTPPDSEPMFIENAADSDQDSDAAQALPITSPQLDPDDTNPDLSIGPPPEVPDKEK